LHIAFFGDKGAGRASHAQGLFAVAEEIDNSIREPLGIIR